MSAAVLEPDDHTETSILALLAEFDLWLRSWGASDNTRQQRLRYLRARLNEWGTPDRVTPQMVQGLLANPEFSDWTRRTYATHLGSFFKWLEEQGRIEQNPMKLVRRSKAPRQVPKPLTPEETTRLLDASSGHVRVWLLLALYAGLRAHEIAKLRGEDVAEDLIYVDGKGGKEAFLPTHPLIWAEAAHYPRQGWWFPSPQHDGHVSGARVTTVTGHLFRECGIANGSIHRARHTYATLLLRKGVNLRVVQTLMRHESLATTAGYLAVDENERRAAVLCL